MRSFLNSGGVHGRIALLHEFDDIFESDIHLAGLGQQSVDLPGKNLDPLAAGQRRALFGNVSPRRASFFHDAGGFELAIGAGHGVGIDEQPTGKDATRGKLFSRCQSPRGDEVLDLLDDLEINRDSVGG